MQTKFQLLSLLLFLSLTFIETQAQQNQFCGSWSGKLELPSTKLEMIFNISEDDKGKLSAKLDVPQQGAANLPVGKVLATNDSLTLKIPAIMGTYHGVFVNNDSLNGKWEQGGNEFDLNLHKTGNVKAVLRPQTPKAPFSYLIEEVEYTNPKSGLKLAGTLTLPKNTNNCPAVILISGSGAQDRNETIFDHKPFWVIADYFAKNGIAVLRVDDRGIGGSEGKIYEATSEDFATDVFSGLNFLNSRTEINSNKIGLLGHSEGGLIAPMVANISNKVAFIIMMAGPGTPGDSILIEQTELAAKAAGMPQQAINAKLFVTRGIINILKTESDTAQRTARFRKAFSGGMYNMMDDDKKELIDKQIAAYNNKWFDFFVNYDPYPALTKLSCPVLALIGEKDVQVPPKSNLSAIERALIEGGNKNFKIMELPNLNHLFQNCETGAPMEYSQIEETISPDVLKIMTDWIIESVKKIALADYSKTD